MTNHKWIDFASFLNGCIYQLEHDNCPFKKYAHLDHLQKLEVLLKIDEQTANQMIKCCREIQSNCLSTIIHLEKLKWDVATII